MKLFSSGVFFVALSLSTVAQDTENPWPILKPATDKTPLPNAKPLTLDGDISLKLAQGCDRFLDAQIDAAAKNRPKPSRENLVKLLGLNRDQRAKNGLLEVYSVQTAQRAIADDLEVYHVRWLAFGDVHGDGLLLVPKGKANPIVADVIAIPDAGETPEDIAGLGKSGNPFALEMALSGCRVLVPTAINREENSYKMTNREWLHRPSFILGRTLIGYELHKIFSGIDCLKSTQGEAPRKVGVIGRGEGGLLALYAGALDERIDTTCVAGYFGERERLWDEPAEHTVFGLVRDFGDAEIASLIAPRTLIIGNVAGPDFVFRPDEKGNPENVTDKYTPKKGKPGKFQIHNPVAEFGRIQNRENAKITTEPAAEFAKALIKTPRPIPADFAFHKIYPDPEGHDLIAERHAVQVAEIVRHNQIALVNSAAERETYFKDLKTGSNEEFEKTIEPYREKFRTEVIGDFGLDRLPFNARSRKYEEGPKTISYEIVLDVFDDVIAYGILTVPKDFDLTSGEKRPVVVCQHGLEGSPQDVIGEPKYKAYKAFATRLAERGFITFAPQNNYKYFDLFRIQQFKAQSIGKTLFSIIVPSHQQMTDWLTEQPFVDGDRIAFYGLSYGGKSAMRIPPLVDNYCLSICSADFNEWVWKNAATDARSLRYSYANKGEYEIFEWNLGGTFNYAEMAYLIAPRPFMVERGHFDGVAPDEKVGHEFGKVRRLYNAKLGIGDRCEIEWFVGPHSINADGTYKFLHKHLNWPEPK